MNLINSPFAGSTANSKDYHLETVGVKGISKEILKDYVGCVVSIREGVLTKSNGYDVLGLVSDNLDVIPVSSIEEGMSIAISKKGVRFVRVDEASEDINVGDMLVVVAEGIKKGSFTKRVATDVGVAIARATGKSFDSGLGYKLVPASYNFDDIKVLAPERTAGTHVARNHLLNKHTSKGVLLVLCGAMLIDKIDKEKFNFLVSIFANVDIKYSDIYFFIFNIIVLYSMYKGIMLIFKRAEKYVNEVPFKSSKTPNTVEKTTTTSLDNSNVINKEKDNE